MPIGEKAKSLAWRIMSSREDLGWNQEDLAEKSGVSRSHISSIETRRTTNITVDVSFALADALGVSRAYILGLTDDPLAEIPDSKLEKEEREEFDAATRQFLGLFQQLSTDKQEILLNLAKVLRRNDEPRIIGGNA